MSGIYCVILIIKTYMKGKISEYWYTFLFREGTQGIKTCRETQKMIAMG